MSLATFQSYQYRGEYLYGEHRALREAVVRRVLN